MRLFVIILLALISTSTDAAHAADGAFAVEIQVNAAESLGPLRPIWRFFGGDEPHYTYMKNVERLLTQRTALRLSPTTPPSTPLDWNQRVLSC